MPERILFPEWRRENEPTKYPFSEISTLTGDDGTTITEGTFLDAALYPIGALAGVYLSSAVIDHQTVTLYLSDPLNQNIASGSLPLVNAPDTITFVDVYGRPAGVIVSESVRLGIFQSWGIGTHTFPTTATEFAATCVFPTPEMGVRAIILDDGNVFVGDVWLVGADGVVFRTEDETVALATCGQPTIKQKVIRMDVVGDPLFRRRLCQPNSLFATPRFVQALHIIATNQDFICTPDGFGNIRITTGNNIAEDTVLRIITTSTGLRIEAAGASPIT